MSSIPSRTRSLRKPADSNSRIGRSAPANTIEKDAGTQPATTERISKSPSRLPTVRSTTTRPASLYGRPPSSSGSNSISSLARPPSSSSTATKPSTTAASSLQRRPSTGRTTTPPTTTEPVKKDRSRPPITQSRHLRNVSTSSVKVPAPVPGHTRTKSSSTLLQSSSTILRPPSRDPADTTTTTRSLRSESQPKRPTFSTLQQHFSPAKSLAPKPHPAAFLAPPSPSKLPSNIAISAETAKLQNELLQLHLLHRDAQPVYEQWKASAKTKLESRFQELVEKNDALLQLEVEDTAKVNAEVLRQWQHESSPGWGLDEKIQVLDEVINGVWNLGDQGGKYARAVHKFEKWLSKCQGILAARETDDGLGKEEFVFLEGLGGSWKDECWHLGRKLESWRNQLRELGSVDMISNLGTIIDSYTKLVQGMITELGVMAQVEKDITKREADWIKSMNDEDEDDENTPTAGACWRLR